MSVAPDTRVIDAVRLLFETNRRGLPVIDNAGELVGIISEGGFHHRAELGTDRPDRPWFNAFFGPGESASKFAHTHGLRVEEVMTKTVICVSPDNGVADIAVLRICAMKQTSSLLPGLGLICVKTGRHISCRSEKSAKGERAEDDDRSSR